MQRCCRQRSRRLKPRKKWPSTDNRPAHIPVDNSGVASESACARLTFARRFLVSIFGASREHFSPDSSDRWWVVGKGNFFRVLSRMPSEFGCIFRWELLVVGPDEQQILPLTLYSISGGPAGAAARNEFRCSSSK